MDQNAPTGNFEDQTLSCRDCGNQFVWTAGEQQFYADKGFTNPPTRCPDCRSRAKAEKMAQRQSFAIVCSNCGREDTVPFEPKGDRPVLCRDCFKNSKGN
jgi:CxxC-x17-CxxC domain-containing protein